MKEFPQLPQPPLPKVFYYWEFRELDGGAIETFVARTPFPTLAVGQQIDLIEMAPLIRYVHHIVVRIGHTPDQSELHARTVLWVDHYPPTPQDLERYDATRFK